MTTRWPPQPAPLATVRRPPGPAAPPPRRGHPITTRLVRRYPGFGGTLGALVMLCLSLTPSLLPRHWVVQAVVSGVLMAIGYAAGAGVGAAARRCRPVLGPARPRAWLLLGGVGAVAVTVSLQLGQAWQRQLRELVGMPGGSWHPVLVFAAATTLAAALVLLARAYRLATRTVATALGRRLPRPAAALASVVAVTAGGLVAGYGAGQGAWQLAAHHAAAADRAVTQPPPSSPYRSGGPDSLVTWESLGAQGRSFVAGATSEAALAWFHGSRAVRPPIRAYVGHASAPDADSRAALAVRELERMGAFDRELVAVVSTTGTGWVNPAVADSLEYLHAGDTAMVATQYSYLPSWISFLVERDRAAESAEALLAAVRDRIDALPPARRPTLVVYGESLGAYGMEIATGDPAVLAHAADGVVLAGPPHHDRTSGDGADPSTVSYLRHASDPVVWWTPELLSRQPPWLREDPGPGLCGCMEWLPVVTFWQVTGDLVTSTAVPDGHGHSYGREIVDAWVSLVAPPAWTAADTGRLQAVLQRS